MKLTLTRALALMGAAVALTASIAACGEDDPEPTTTVPTPTEVTTTVMVPTPTTITSVVPTASPLTEQARKTALFDAIKNVDPQLVADENEAWEKGEKVCEAVEAAPTDQDGLVERTEKEFAKATDPDGVPPAEALKVLDAVRTWVCPAE